MKKPSDIFEGSDSSLKKAFDEATENGKVELMPSMIEILPSYETDKGFAKLKTMTTPTHDTQLREEFDREWKDGYIENVKTYRKSQPVADWWLSKIHSARKEAQMEVLKRMEKRVKQMFNYPCKCNENQQPCIHKWSNDFHIISDIIQSERESVNNT